MACYTKCGPKRVPHLVWGLYSRSCNRRTLASLHSIRSTRHYLLAVVHLLAQPDVLFLKDTFVAAYQDMTVTQEGVVIAVPIVVRQWPRQE